MTTPKDFIEIIPNALPDEFCDQLINAFEQHPGVLAGRTGHGVDTTKKNSLDLTLDQHDDLAELKGQLLKFTFDKIVDYLDKYHLALIGAVSVQVEDKSGGAVNLSPDNYAELGRPRAKDITGYLYRSGSINLQKYLRQRGGYFHWHSEHYPQAEQTEALHRVLLYMFYLNDVDEGGETEFYYQGKSIKPKKGTMVIAPAGFTHSHRGNMPISNDKYIATSWIMFNRAEKLYA